MRVRSAQKAEQACLGIDRKWAGGGSVASGGFTLIELVLTTMILSLIAVLLIPPIRALNRERGIREAARLTGSFFADAGNRARTEGFAAVGMVRNLNYSRTVNSEDGAAQQQVYYASNLLYLLRRLPPYTGNDIGDYAEVMSVTPPVEGSLLNGTVVVRVPEPLDTAVADSLINGSGRRLELGELKTSIFVSGVAALPAPNDTLLELTCQWPNHLAPPPVGERVRFRLDRPLEEIPNSALQLPRGYYVNLNYSGPTTALKAGVSEKEDADNNPVTWTFLSENRQSNNLNVEHVVVVFGPSGGIDRVYSNGQLESDENRWFPISSLNFCLSADEEPNTFGPDADSLPRGVIENGRDILNEDDVFWVSIDHRNGSVSVSPIAAVESTVPSDGNPNLDEVQAGRILQSQRFRAFGQAASQ